MAVLWLWGGGAGPEGFVARTKLTASATSVRLVVSQSPDLTDPVYSAPTVPTAQLVATLPVTGLQADRTYQYAVEIDGVIDWTYTGTIRTHPPLGEPADFTIAAASCAGTGSPYPVEGSPLVPDRVSNHPVFTEILSRDPLEFVHMGDMHYYDIGSGVHVTGYSATQYRRAWDDVLAQGRQHALYRGAGLRYVWDDHDFGPNDSDRTSLGRDAAIQVYREVVPHGPLAAGDGLQPIYQTWTIGRVQFVGLDARSDRDPFSTPQGPTKTMLGDAQRIWFEQILATSSAKAIVIVSPSVWWEPNRVDGWWDYQDEQQWVIDRINQYGWTGRVVIISGDVHSLAIDTGGNSPGGIPVYQFASMDSTYGSTPQYHYDTGPSLPGRGQYGTLRCRDMGARIEITGTCWVGSAVWREHTHIITFDDDGEEPTPVDPLPPVVEARSQPDITWVACNAVTGKIITEIPEVTGGVGRLLGSYTSYGLKTTAPLYGPGAIGDLLWQGTEPGRTLLAAIVNGRPGWVGLILSRSAGWGPNVDLGTVTPEGYWDRRRVRDHTFAGTDQARIAETLMRDAQGISGVGAGLPILIDAPTSGTSRDRDYLLTDRKTVYSCLRELMALPGGPEFTIDAEWSDYSETAISLIARVRDRIGTAAVRPNSVFEVTAPGVLDTKSGANATYTLTEDFADGKFANWVQAYSSGEGDDQPSSTPAVATWPIKHGAWPIYESHFQPTTNLIDTLPLDQHATARLERQAYGARVLKIQAQWNADPRLNLDWRLGDDIAWRLYGHRHPNGLIGQGRALGYDLDPAAGIVSPVMLDPSEESIYE